MNHFRLVRGELHAEAVPLGEVARRVGTPTYVYSAATLTRHFRVLDEAIPVEHLVCYSVKANSNLSILSLFARLGSGFDIVSGGELFRVVQAGGDPRQVVFSGVGKTDEEIDFALRQKILMFNVESAEELHRIGERARRLRRRAPVALRVNPDVDPRTHPSVATGLRKSKFGIPVKEARQLYRSACAADNLQWVGLDCHIGSQLTTLGPLSEALGKLTRLFQELRAEGIPLRYFDVGGGLGITYRHEDPPPPRDYGRVVARAVKGINDLTVIVEPGRVLVGNAGVLLTRVLYRKRSTARGFLVVDAGMNDLVRPALYGSHHDIHPVVRRPGTAQTWDVVGPVCESTDVLARSRSLSPVQPGDLLAIRSAGAYGMSMASNYNSRPRPAEVLIDGSSLRVIRRRETLRDLIRGEGQIR